MRSSSAEILYCVVIDYDLEAARTGPPPSKRAWPTIVKAQPIDRNTRHFLVPTNQALPRMQLPELSHTVVNTEWLYRHVNA